MAKRGQAPGRDGGDGDILKGLAAGVAGGLAGALLMEGFQALWAKISESVEQPREKQSLGRGGLEDGGDGASRGRQGVRDGRQSKGEGGEQEPANVKAAEAISEGVFGHELEKGEKKAAGEAVHYAMGAASGAIYGAASEVVPFVRVGAGLPFGAAVWLIADDVAVPALGLSKSPTEYPPSTHAYALASHLVYGLTTELVRGAVRRAL
jgi:hypothetical protein